LNGEFASAAAHQSTCLASHLELCNTVAINDLYGGQTGTPDTKSFNLDRYTTQFTVPRLV